MYTRTRRVSVLAIAVAGLYSAVIQAEPVANNQLEEVVVTAQKRSEKLQDVPVAVTVVSQEQLAAQHVYTIADLARTAPSLEMVQAFGGPGGGGQIRGIGTKSLNTSAEGAVGIVVDGVPQGNVPGNNIYDIAQVEVLRGPQGTLFGLTSSAGVINMTTVAPDPSGFHATVHVDLSAKGTVGSKFGEETVRGGLNLPLSENSALRLSVNGDFVRGVQRNAYNGDEDISHDGGFRLRYQWKSDKVKLNLIGDYDHRTQNYGDPQFTYVNIDPNSNPHSALLATQLAACGVVASWGNQDRCSARPNYSANKNTGFSAQVDIDLGGPTLTSITSWRKNEQPAGSVDIMSNPQESTQIYAVDAISMGRQLAEELRVSSPTGSTVDYTAGVFYSDYDSTSGYAPGGGFHVDAHPAPPVFVPIIFSATPSEITNKSAAAFGQMTYHLSSQLGLIGGLRYTQTKLSSLTGMDPQDATSVASSTDTTESNVSGKVGVQYKISPEINSYATYTRGYKGPLISPPANGLPASKVNAEIPNAYELGLKGVAVGGRLNYDASLFYTTVHDYQGQRCFLTPFGNLSCPDASIPSVTTRGVELEMFGKPVQGLWLSAGFIYDDAKFPAGWTGLDPNNLTGGGSTNLGGLQLVGVPKTKFTLSGEYSHGYGAMQGYFGADAVYKSDMRMGFSGDPGFVYPAHWSLGARLGVRSSNNRWSAELFARNLTDEHEPATLFGGPSFLSPVIFPGFPPGSDPLYPMGRINGISGWMTPAGLRQVGLSVEARW